MGCAQSTLALAIENNNLPEIESILATGANPDVGLHRGCTPLVLACGGIRYKKCVKRFDALRKMPNMSLDKYKEEMQQFKIAFGLIPEREDIVQRLLAAGADPNAKQSKYKFHALDCAAALGHCNSIRLLLQHGADVDAVDDDDGGTALGSAAYFNNIESMKILVKANAQVNHCDNEGETALFHASGLDCSEVVQILLEAGADPTIQRKDGATALHDAVQWKAEGTLKELLKAKVDPNVRDNDGCTPLIEAASGDLPSLVQILLDAGADIDSLDNEKDTAIHEAASTGNYQIADLLIKAGCALNIQNVHGCTPLILALDNEHLRVAELILSSKRDVAINAIDNNGFTALETAEHFKIDSLKPQLLGCGAVAAVLPAAPASTTEGVIRAADDLLTGHQRGNDINTITDYFEGREEEEQEEEDCDCDDCCFM